MKPTSLSLLDRLKAAGPEASDWGRLHGVYLPLIRRWLGRVPGLGAEADDLAQDVFAVVVRELPRFERRREGSFRAWLRQVAVNRIRTHQKRRPRDARGGPDPSQAFLDGLTDPHSELAREWDRDHDRFVLQKLQELVRPDFSPTTWTAFQAFAVEGRTAAEVARETGLSENAVIQAKARILKRLREEAGDFLS